MKSYSTLQCHALIWLLWGPFQLLRLLLAANGDDPWAEYEDEVLVLRDLYGRETYLIPDSITGAKERPDPHVGWSEHKWRQLDEAMWPPSAWTPAAEGVQHVLFRLIVLGKSIAGFTPPPAICDSS